MSKVTVACGLRSKVLLGHKVVTKGVLGGNSTSATAGSRGKEEVDVGDGEASDGYSGGTDEDQVHQVTAVLVNVILIGGSGHIEADGTTARTHGGRGEGGRGAGEGKEGGDSLHGRDGFD